MPRKSSKKQMFFFREKVYKVVSRLPKGKVLTYKQVAFLAGKSKAWRAVGNILNNNYNSNIPCHRVIRSDRLIGGYNRGEKRKIYLLNKEGVVIRNRRVYQKGGDE